MAKEEKEGEAEDSEEETQQMISHVIKINRCDLVT